MSQPYAPVRLSEAMYTYFAFISYKREDSAWAVWLQKRLQAYRLPSKLCKQYAGLPRRLSPVFLDKTNLTSGKLNEGLREESAASKFLIVICSRHTHDAPKYIDHEIQSFLDAGHDISQIIPFIVDSSDSPEQTCFPPKLQELCAGEEVLGVNIHDAGARLAFLKVVAYMQGLKLTEIESADDRRRRRNRTLAIAGACALLAVTSLTGFSHYDYFVPKDEYYLDYTTRYGVPVGIGRLTREETLPMSQHYTISSVKHQVTELRHENSAGTLIGHFNIDQTDRPTRAIYGYRDNGTLETVTCYDVNGKAVLVMDYDKNMKVVDLKQSDEYSTGASLLNRTTELKGSVLNASPNSDYTVKSSIGRYIVEYDDNGYLSNCLYAKYGTDIRVSDADGIWGLRYERDELGRAVRVRYLTYTDGGTYVEIGTSRGVYGRTMQYNADNDLVETAFYGKDGKPIAADEQWMIQKNTYDKNHNVICEEYVNANGELMLNAYGFAKCFCEYNERGNGIYISFFGTDGLPTFHIEGYASKACEYNDDGNAVTNMYYDSNCNLTLCNEGFAIGRCEYNALGMVAAVSYFDADGQPSLCKEGYSECTITYDKRGSETKIAYFGTDGLPVLSINGYAGWTSKYNGRSDLIAQKYYGTDGLPVLCKDGHAGWKSEYDERGNLTKVEYYGTDGVPILSKDGYAGWTNEYDERGNITKVTYFGTDTLPILIKDGYAGWANEYDEHGNIIRVVDLGTDGLPIRSIFGYAGWTREYDERGNAIQTTYVDMDSLPIQCKDGFAGWTDEYNEYGDIVRTEYFSADSLPVLCRDGYAGWTNEYDERGNVIRITYFGTDGLPTLCNSGYAERTIMYDERGNVLEECYFDTNNMPIISQNHAFRWKYEYNDYGDITKISTFGIDNEPCISTYGYFEKSIEYNDNHHIIRHTFTSSKESGHFQNLLNFENEYDARGNLIRTSYFDSDGNPACTSDIYSVITYAYDARDNQIELKYLGVDGRLSSNYYGICRITYEFDEHDYCVRENWYIRGVPNINEDGSDNIELEHSRLYEYDEYGNNTFVSTIDGKGKLKASQAGIARIDYQYNSWGYNTGEQYFGADNRPIASSDGCYGWTAQRNERGDNVRYTYTGPDGAPMMSTYGYAGYSKTYDRNGQCTAVVYYDAEGNEIEPVKNSCVIFLPTTQDMNSYDKNISVLKQYRVLLQLGDWEYSLYDTSFDESLNKLGDIISSSNGLTLPSRYLEYDEATDTYSIKSTEWKVGYMGMRILDYNLLSNETEELAAAMSLMSE